MDPLYGFVVLTAGLCIFIILLAVLESVVKFAYWLTRWLGL